ncbi:uncharacterized protein JCM10292_004754 [Rhodotorula paludigena]|uniref:uncharacterized protein n=1 Tax=Rhodotorula paludigena TaxID=86838 RepID=UPI00317CF5AF
MEENPALSKRNFYMVQNHWATKRHYDLRLHCYGETISWAIPRELSKPAEQTERLAIETLRHRIRYTLYEGATVRSAEKPTGVWDIGYYTVHETKNKHERKERIREDFGLDDGETTDEEASLEPDDVNQERLFFEGYHYASFKPTPAIEGRAALPVKPDTSGRMRAFVIELHGRRWNGLRLTFKHASCDDKVALNKETGLVTRNALWLVTLSSSSPSIPLAATEDPHLAALNRSILTDRTMEEIRADTRAYARALRAEDEAASQTGLTQEQRKRRELAREWAEEEAEDELGVVESDKEKKAKKVKGEDKLPGHMYF